MTRLLPLLLMASAAAFAAEPPAIDWKKVNAETLEHYLKIIRTDTSNPPGNESLVAEYVKSVLAKDGIQAALYEGAPNRANLVARIKGTGRLKPLLIMGHSDVVGVQRDKWPVPPFEGVRKDGYIWGRGTLDDKDNLTACLMVMLMLKRSGITLDRDLIFLSEASEEGGSAGVGIDFMVKNHWPEIEAEYALAEGGAGLSREGEVIHYDVATTEKVPRGIRLVAHGAAGHGSRPRPDNAVAHIAMAVAKAAQWQPPMRLNDTTRTYFERLAAISPPDKAARYLHIGDPSQTESIQRYFAENEYGHNSILRTSISPTIIKAGFRANVIPSEAEAYLDVRALPDEDMDAFRARLAEVIHDSSVEILPAAGAGRPSGAPSRLDTPMWTAIEKVHKRMYPKAATLPIMMTGATDMAQLRAKGVQCYGIGPIVEETDAADHGAHGDAERIKESNLYAFVQYLWNIVMEAGVAH